MPAAQLPHSFTPLTVSPGGALLLAGIVPSHHSVRMADKCAHQQICRGTFPFPLITLAGGRRRHLVRIVDVEATLARLAGCASTSNQIHASDVVTAKRGRGRPRKPERGAVSRR